MKKLVLVTGGAGFIGSHLVEALVARGYGVRVLDSLIYGHREWVHPEAEFLEGDICDLKTCRQAMEGMAGVFHMAAMSRSGPSLDAIDVCTQANIVGTQNVLIAAREAQVAKVVYSGSSTYYGSQPVPHREYETPSDLLNFYGLSKRVGEQYCLMFDSMFKVPAVVLRYFNVYGPRQPKFGAYALVLGIFLGRWAAGEKLEIHGDGLQRRDFVHVRDVAQANIMAFESNLHGEIFNVGSGVNVSIKELADAISKDQVHGPRRAGDAAETLADISRIRTALGWEPNVSFQDGLRELMDHVKSGGAGDRRIA
jgi:UDP-glucose 4-epimerase